MMSSSVQKTRRVRMGYCAIASTSRSAKLQAGCAVLSAQPVFSFILVSADEVIRQRFEAVKILVWMASELH